jgi:hypothetical protein
MTAATGGDRPKHPIVPSVTLTRGWRPKLKAVGHFLNFYRDTVNDSATLSPLTAKPSPVRALSFAVMLGPTQGGFRAARD